jgi:hypothetical protein
MSTDNSPLKNKNVLLYNALSFIVVVVSGKQHSKRNEESASFASMACDKLDEKTYNNIMRFCEELENKGYSVCHFKSAIADRFKQSSALHAHTNGAVSVLDRLTREDTFVRQLRIAKHEGLIKKQSFIDWAIENQLTTLSLLIVCIIILPWILYWIWYFL